MSVLALLHSGLLPGVDAGERHPVAQRRRQGELGAVDHHAVDEHQRHRLRAASRPVEHAERAELLP
jgi:hypothetical protein